MEDWKIRPAVELTCTGPRRDWFLFHGIKGKISQDFPSEFKKRGPGKNPDVFIDAEGLAFTPELLRKLANAGVLLTISCYEDADYVHQQYGEGGRRSEAG